MGWLGGGGSRKKQDRGGNCLKRGGGLSQFVDLMGGGGLGKE